MSNTVYTEQHNNTSNTQWGNRVSEQQKDAKLWEKCWEKNL